MGLHMSKHKPCPGCIDRMVWYLWPGTLGGFRSHICPRDAVPFAIDWAPDHLRWFWLAAYAVVPDPLTLRARDRELASNMTRVRGAPRRPEMGLHMSEVLPPGRGLCYAKPVLLESGPALECLCDCALTTIISLDLDGPLTEAQEIAYTCDQCQSVHWLMLYPVVEDDPA